MLHLIRFILFTALFFGNYKVYPYIVSNVLALELTICAFVSLIVVITYALYENWEKKEDVRNNIRKGSS